jgi:hypothetical protein
LYLLVFLFSQLILEDIKHHHHADASSSPRCSFSLGEPFVGLSSFVFSTA